MSYSVEADFKFPDALLISLSDDKNVTKIASDIITESIAYADSIIDKYISERYDIPLAAPVPAQIKYASIDIALWWLYYRRRGGDVPKVVNATYLLQLEWLKSIQKGDMSLPDVDTSGVATDYIIGNKDSDSKIFTATYLSKRLI